MSPSSRPVSAKRSFVFFYLLVVPDLETREGSDVTLDHGAADARRITRLGDTGRVGLDACARGGLGGEHRRECAGIEVDSDLLTIDVGGADRVRRRSANPVNGQFRIRLVAGQPIRHVGVVAILREKQANRTVCEIVLDVEFLEEILPDQSRGADLAAADEELHVLETDARESEFLDRGDLGVRATADSPDDQAVKRTRFEAVLGRRRGAHHAPERAAVQNELGLAAVDRRGNRGPQTVHRDRQLGDLADRAFLVRRRRGVGRRRNGADRDGGADSDENNPC